MLTGHWGYWGPDLAAQCAARVASGQACFLCAVCFFHFVRLLLLFAHRRYFVVFDMWLLVNKYNKKLITKMLVKVASL